MLATADDTVAIFGQNNSASLPTAKFLNVSSEFAEVLLAEGPAGNGCGVDGHGDLTCTGSKSAVVPVEDGQKMVALYAVEAPENWFEDFGSRQLANGVATVSLEATYAQTVNTSIEYHVFLTPRVTATACTLPTKPQRPSRCTNCTAGIRASRSITGLSLSARDTSRFGWRTRPR